jgi:glucose/arabinose dehydrogenase
MRPLPTLFGLWLVLSTQSSFAVQDKLSAIQLPEGYTISVYASGLPSARHMAVSEQGIAFVGTKSDKVYALIPAEDFSQATQVQTLLTGLTWPSSVALHDGNLYVAELGRITRYDNIEQQLAKPPAPVVIRDDLPNAKWHGAKIIGIGPDEKLYVTIGMPCNTCIMQDERYGSISYMNPDGSDFAIYAHGLRNSVGLAWNPADQSLWFTDNGQDYLGDDYPPDELNRAPRAGMNFGFPYYINGNVPAPDMRELPPVDAMTPPSWQLPAHVAPLGMLFYQDNVLIAEHGSWNRSSKIGYRISQITIDGERATDYTIFASGWLEDETVWGRPVDLALLPDGSLLVSDDYAGVVYRISRTAP